MTSPCDRLAEYVDGELDAGDREAFSLHLAGCASCRDALHDALQLVTVETIARGGAPAREATIRPITEAARRPRRRSRSAPAVALAAASAAAVLLVVWWLHHRAGETAGPDPAPLVIATAESRALEGRISYAAADRYRPYEVPRAGSAARPLDQIPLDTLARLEHRGDLHGVAAALLLMNDVQRAADYLARAGADPGVASDRALVQRAGGHLEEALVALDGVLASVPGHPQALWNRALVLADLGLSLSAAADFEAVAARNEPGWSEEARRREKALSDQMIERRTAYEHLASIDGPAVSGFADAVTPELAHRFPGMTRIVFYDAVRSASSAEAVRALARIAATLDAIYGGKVLVDHVERIARADFSRRAPLARRYAALLAGQRLDAAGTNDLLAALRAAHQDDILVGAMLRLTAGHVPPPMIPELRRLVDGLHDPWFDLFAIEQAVGARMAEGDHLGAEALALPALARCETRPVDYRCASLERVLGESYLLSLRLPDARRVLAAGWARARRGGEWYQEQVFLQDLARLEVLQDDVAGSTLPLVRAYAGEVVRRQPTRCDLEAWQHDLIALMMTTRVDLDRARQELAQVDAIRARCPSVPPDLARLDAKALVLRDPAAGSVAEVDALRAEISAQRQSPALGPGDRAALDQIEGRLLIERDRPAGTALLERAIASTRSAPTEDTDVRRARSYAYSILVLDAGRAGDWDRVWTLLGGEAGITPPARCALGAALEDRASVVVVRDAGGVGHGAFDPARPANALDASSLVPAALRDALRGCEAVEVVARPPLHGLPGLLPVDIAWSYRTAGERPPAGAAPDHLRHVVISGAEPPAALGLPRLLPWRSATAPDLVLEGLSATPSRVLAALADASFVEIHAHGTVNAAVSDASFLVLSPEPDGSYALTARAIRAQPLRGRPVVVLAACHAAATAKYRHEAWNLPAAFIAAGARSVIASTDVISDGDAGGFFDDLVSRIEHGAAPAVALHDTRAQWLTAHPAAAWTRALMVFQ